mmetsp:Transcript_65384/g.120538  ORF Transcript_65384/g.120538 Transcript_65384/m.120538 type:complete len:472 (+) Transcript_65384:3-1418(+)
MAQETSALVYFLRAPHAMSCATTPNPVLLLSHPQQRTAVKEMASTRRPPLPPGPPPQPQGNVGDDDEVVWEEHFMQLPGGDAEYDSLGFAAPPVGNPAAEAAKAFEREFEVKAQRRLQRFEQKRKRLRTPGAWTELPQSELKELLRKGVPDEYRGEVWWSILRCEDYRSNQEAKLQLQGSAYSHYMKQDFDPKVAEEIERDLPRTFPDHKKFRSVAGRSQLRNVLRAFAKHAPRVQYCQGLNFIAALLLIVLADEEKAFWALAAAVDFLGVELYYTEGMTLLRADMRALVPAMAARCPKVERWFRQNGVEVTSICSSWFVTWFAKALPAPTVLRVWDTLFFEGFKVLFRVAVGIFKRSEASILRCADFDEIMEQAKNWPRDQIDHNELIKASFRGFPAMRRHDLIADRENALQALEQEDQELRRRQQANREAAARAAAERREAAQRAASASSMTSGAETSGTEDERVREAL